MSPLEIISRLCDVTENLSAIVKKQQTIIEQSKIEETVRAELRQEVEETDREMDVLEYHMRKYCDTDDIEATEFGKENEKKDTQEETEQRATTDTMVMVKLENIADDLKDIKRESRENREEMKTLRERVVIVEQSLKSYHKRLDGEQHSDR